MTLVIFAIIGIICAAIAHYKGRSIIGWFFIGFFFPVVGLIVILVVSNLKEAKAKEVHMEMEQRRLSEQLRQERIKSEQLRKYTQARLDVHDQELKIDTRHIGHLLEQPSMQPVLGDGQQFPGEAIGIGPAAADPLPMPVVPLQPQATRKGKIKTQCPHCQARFKVPEKHKGRRAKCSKCGKPFVITAFVESTTVQQCASCGRKIGEAEKAYISDNRILCVQCDERLRPESKQVRTGTQGWYYQQADTTAGPLSLDALKQLIQQGKITSSTYLWHESLPEWTPAAEISELGMEIDHG